MAETLVIRQGWFPSIRWGASAAFFASMAVYSAFFSMDDNSDPAFSWAIALVAAVCGLVASRCLWRTLRGSPEAILGADGIRARSCDNVLIPWDLVTSVSLGSKSMTTPTASATTTAILEAASRHDVYDIVLDKAVLDIGVKHSGNLTGIGFTLVPANLTASSRQIRDAFLRHLPAARCHGFGPTDTLDTAADFARRGNAMVAAVILEATETAQAEQTIPDR
jgi:hypothetical protein